MQYTRQQVISRLRSQIERNQAIVCAGAGTGISAKFIERGGADLIIVYNSGRFRMAGHSSLCGLLALGDANEIVMEMGEREILPVVQRTPVIAGVNGTDPTRVMRRFLARRRRRRVLGREQLPDRRACSTGASARSSRPPTSGSHARSTMIATAHELGLFTIVYAFTPQEAAAMAAAGADAVVAHMGLTVGGSIGHEPRRTRSRSTPSASACRRSERRPLAAAARRDRALPRRADRHARRTRPTS